MTDKELKKYCMIKVNKAKECYICKKLTNYTDYIAEVRICSIDCHDKLWCKLTGYKNDERMIKNE